VNAWRALRWRTAAETTNDAEAIAYSAGCAG
jgi:hypothetical protein